MDQMHELALHAQDGIPVSARAATERDERCALSRLLHGRGLHAALGYLNERTRYRFTGLYRADPPLLRNIGLFDRENPDIDASGRGGDAR